MRCRGNVSGGGFRVRMVGCGAHRNLNFTLGHRQVAFVVDVQPLQGVANVGGGAVRFHQEYHCEAAFSIGKVGTNMRL